MLNFHVTCVSRRNLFCKIGTIARIEEVDPWMESALFQSFSDYSELHVQCIPRCIEFAFRASASLLNWNLLFSFQKEKLKLEIKFCHFRQKVLNVSTALNHCLRLSKKA